MPADRPIDGHSWGPLLRGEKAAVRDWIYAYLGDRQVLRDRRWLLENRSPHDGTGRISAAHTTETDQTGAVEVPLSGKVLARPTEPWAVKLGLTGPAGASVVFEAVEFVK